MNSIIDFTNRVTKDEYWTDIDIQSYAQLTNYVMDVLKEVDRYPNSTVLIRRKSIYLQTGYLVHPKETHLFQGFYQLIKDNRITFNQCSFVSCNFDANVIKNHIFEFCTFVDCTFNSSIIDKSEFIHCSFLGSSFVHATIRNCVLAYCDSTYNFSFVDFEGTEFKTNSITFNHCKNIKTSQSLPGSGAFIGWKKVFANDCIDSDYAIVKLQIPASAKRVGVNKKCRCNKAKVLKIYKLCYDSENNIIKVPINCASSMRDLNFKYTVGETIEIPDFDEELNECSTGIHFVLSEEDAINFEY